MYRLLLLVAVVALLAGCTNAAIVDSETKMEVGKANVTEGTLVFEHNYDNMDRGNHDLMGSVVVDPQYYKSNPVKRGDVVYYKNPTFPNSKLTLPEYEISRVIALPDEIVKIEKGQIFINGSKLDTFYGRAHRAGLDLKQMKKLLQQSGLDDHTRKNIEGNVKWTEENEEANRKELILSNDQFFIVGDDWFRSADSRHFGPIKKENISGKVLGMK